MVLIYKANINNHNGYYKLTTDNDVLIIVKILQSRDIFIDDTGPRSSILNTIFSLQRLLDVTIISVISPE